MAATDAQNLENLVKRELASPPSISLQILGVHMNGEQSEIDFDLRIEYPNEAKIKCGKLFTRDQNEFHSWSQQQDPEGDFLAISRGWIEAWLGDGDERKSWIIQNSCYVQEKDLTAIKGHLEALARRTGYGGDVTSMVHTPLFEKIIPESTAVLQVEWTPDNLFIPMDNDWNSKVMNAMVDKRKGSISFDEPKPSHGRSPFRRAMKLNDTAKLVSRDQNKDGAEYTVLKYSKWGSST
ncbi:hypothetical protein N7533_001290 [Penicillium manginii]|uniref:uncharacterized protein n=1 Tax=Penicillium manginii TaxID=203109 RepID=UPI0025484314|nr:uncharacterized protein N7533_001290 [Penicillium manginii]KAJ5762609.1 hypothetical protein N7533_001290 [Penicillium manginii]